MNLPPPAVCLSVEIPLSVKKPAPNAFVNQLSGERGLKVLKKGNCLKAAENLSLAERVKEGGPYGAAADKEKKRVDY